MTVEIESEYSDTNSEEYDESDSELQAAFARGDLKPGLNEVKDAPKTFSNNVVALRQLCGTLSLGLEWLETLDCVTDQAPLAPELADQMQQQQNLRQNQLQNNKKLQQFAPEQDPVLNDFKREVMFHRQAQAAVMEAVPKLKAAGIAITRPDDYFGEMAKSDEHMQKVRENLSKKQMQHQRSEKVKQLRAQRKEGKALQTQAKLQSQREKKQMLNQIKRVRKGVDKNLDFLDKRGGGPSKRAAERRQLKDKKFGFGGKKRGSKLNTKSSAEDISEYKRPARDARKGSKNKRPGKDRRTNLKNRKRNK